MRIRNASALGVLFLLLSAGAAAQADFSSSMHATRAGMARWYDTGFKQLTGISIADLGCTSCHAAVDADGKPYSGSYQPGCIDCHPSGDFSRAALRQERCLGCHTRQAREIDAGLPDVHRSAGLQCWDCHRATEIHGDGVVRTSVLERGSLTTDCVDCHVHLPSEHASNDPHDGKLHCTSCHTSTVISCYNCHFESKVEHQVERPFDVIRGFVLLVNRERDGKVGTGTVQSMTYQGKAFAAFAPYHSHSIIEHGRSCSACHFNMGGQNQAIASYNGTGSIPFATWNSGDSTLSWMKGVIPLPYDYTRTLRLDFLTYDGNTDDPVGADKNWSLIANAWDAEHMLYGTPLTPVQMEKLGFILSSVRQLGGRASAFSLAENHPNPFAGTTRIRYTIPRATAVRLTVHDALGRCVKTVVSELQHAGNYEAEFDGRGLDAGIYFCRLDADGTVSTRKMLMMK